MSAQKITIEPVTRIEGHARITLHLNEGARSKVLSARDEFRGWRSSARAGPISR